MWLTYSLIAVILFIAEVVYFCIAKMCNIIDKPNERSSHKKVVLRGGGIIFTIGLWIWSIVFGFQYLWLLAGVTLAAGISFVDDIHTLPGSLRLVVQFTAMLLVFQEIGLLHWDMWWVVPIILFFCVGATNIINFMDGINGITAAYGLAMLIPILLLNIRVGFIEESYLVVAILGIIVFSVFNFRPKGKAMCFAGDVGSIGIAFIIIFAIGKLMLATQDISYIVFFLLYGIDGSFTIFHRIKLHENLCKAHRKHAYQLMVNELNMSHVAVSLIYMCLQLIVSLGFIYVCSNTILAHWIYLIGAAFVLAVAYILFMKKYYHLHEEYLASLKF